MIDHNAAGVTTGWLVGPAAEQYQFWSGRWWRSGQQSAPIPCHISPDSLPRIARNTAGSNIAGYQ